MATTAQTALIVQTPDPVTIAAPDTAELMRTYTTEILPLARYTITDSRQYCPGKQRLAESEGVFGGHRRSFRTSM